MRTLLFGRAFVWDEWRQLHFIADNHEQVKSLTRQNSAVASRIITSPLQPAGLARQLDLALDSQPDHHKHRTPTMGLAQSSREIPQRGGNNEWAITKGAICENSANIRSRIGKVYNE